MPWISRQTPKSEFLFRSALAVLLWPFFKAPTCAYHFVLGGCPGSDKKGVDRRYCALDGTRDDTRAGTECYPYRTLCSYARSTQRMAVPPYRACPVLT
eukprot:3044894-Rhodomonas_salina.1